MLKEAHLTRLTGNHPNAGDHLVVPSDGTHSGLVINHGDLMDYVKHLHDDLRDNTGSKAPRFLTLQEENGNSHDGTLEVIGEATAELDRRVRVRLREDPTKAYSVVLSEEKQADSALARRYDEEIREVR
jgi:hypothetical protein